MEKFGKKFEIYKTFSPPNRKYKAFIAFLCDNIFNFEAKEAKFFFFFRSKNPENLRGFLDPHQIFQENQGFNAFLCGNIFQIFAISVIFSSNFLSDIVIVALTWLKKGPKKEN